MSDLQRLAVEALLLGVFPVSVGLGCGLDARDELHCRLSIG
jgi:hypothetical protein